MNAGVSGFVRSRLAGSPQARAADGGGNGTDRSFQLGSPPESGRGPQITELSPRGLLSWLEGRRKRPREAQEPFDVDALRRRATDFLEHEDWHVRNVGVKLVGLAGCTDMLPRLLGMLLDRTKDTFFRRVFGGDFRQVGFIRRNIVKTLGDLNQCSAEVEEALLESLHDPYYEVRSCAAAAFRRLAPQLSAREEIARRLVGCLKDPSFEVVAEAALALGQVGGEEAVGEVLGLYAHRNWRVREAALQTTCDLVGQGVVRNAGLVEEALRNLLIPCPSFKPNFPLRGVLRDLALALSGLKGR